MGKIIPQGRMLLLFPQGGGGKSFITYYSSFPTYVVNEEKNSYVLKSSKFNSLVFGFEEPFLASQKLPLGSTAWANFKWTCAG